MAISLGGAAEYGESVPASDDDESSGEGSRACHAAGAARAEERGRTKALAARAERLRRLRDVLSDLAADSPGRARRGRARADELASERGVSDARAPAQACVTPVPARTPQRGHGRGSALPALSPAMCALSARGTLSPTELAAAFVTHAEAAQGGVRARARASPLQAARTLSLYSAQKTREQHGDEDQTHAMASQAGGDGLEPAELRAALARALARAERAERAAQLAREGADDARAQLARAREEACGRAQEELPTEAATEARAAAVAARGGALEVAALAAADDAARTAGVAERALAARRCPAAGVGTRAGAGARTDADADVEARAEAEAGAANPQTDEEGDADARAKAQARAREDMGVGSHDAPLLLRAVDGVRGVLLGGGGGGGSGGWAKAAAGVAALAVVSAGARAGIDMRARARGGASAEGRQPALARTASAPAALVPDPSALPANAALPSDAGARDASAGDALDSLRGHEARQQAEVVRQLQQLGQQLEQEQPIQEKELAQERRWRRQRDEERTEQLPRQADERRAEEQQRRERGEQGVEGDAVEAHARASASALAEGERAAEGEADAPSRRAAPAAEVASAEAPTPAPTRRRGPKAEAKARAKAEAKARLEAEANARARAGDARAPPGEPVPPPARAREAPRASAVARTGISALPDDPAALWKLYDEVLAAGDAAMGMSDAHTAAAHFTTAVEIMDQLARTGAAAGAPGAPARGGEDPHVAAEPSPAAPAPLPELAGAELAEAEALFAPAVVAAWAPAERALYEQYAELMRAGDAALRAGESQRALTLYSGGQARMEELRAALRRARAAS